MQNWEQYKWPSTYNKSSWTLNTEAHNLKKNQWSVNTDITEESGVPTFSVTDFGAPEGIQESWSWLKPSIATETFVGKCTYMVGLGQTCSHATRHWHVNGFHKANNKIAALNFHRYELLLNTWICLYDIRCVSWLWIFGDRLSCLAKDMILRTIKRNRPLLGCILGLKDTRTQINTAIKQLLLSTLPDYHSVTFRIKSGMECCQTVIQQNV